MNETVKAKVNLMATKLPLKTHDKVAEVKNIGERLDSCKISMNAKGLWSGDVKVYMEDIDKAMKKALEKAAQLEMVILEKNKDR